MGSLAPALLLSMPQLVDPNFNHTVVLLCKHSEEGGAFGLVVNRPLITTGRFVVQIESSGEEQQGAPPPGVIETSEVLTADHDLQVWVGGPVEQHRSWMLVGSGFACEDEALGVQVADGLYLSTSPELLQRLLAPTPPSRARLMMGYAGWDAGQLEAELHESAWLLSDIDADLIFDTPADLMWETAIRRLGADPAALHGSRGVH
jgi:putative transcriptional regulator